MKRKRTKLIALALAMGSAGFMGGRFTAPEDVSIRWDPDAIRMLLDLGLEPSEFVQALQLEAASGRPVDPMALSMAMKIPDNVLTMAGWSHIAPHVFEDER